MAARQAGAHSLMVIPLAARGVIIGIVVLYRLAGSDPFTADDLSLARDLVTRAAVSIDNAWLYTRERATALALQRGLLPRQIPQVPGLQVCYRYMPAETSAEIGGDWAAGTWDIATAGHPLPAIARPGHPATFPSLPPGLPLGTGLQDSHYQATRLHLPPASTLLLYTDGLIENPATGIDAGLARLACTLTTISQLPVPDACDTLLATLAPSPADDIAILMART